MLVFIDGPLYQSGSCILVFKMVPCITEAAAMLGKMQILLRFSLFTILLLHFHPIPFNHYLITLLQGHMAKHAVAL